MFLANYADVFTERAAAGHDRAVRGEQRGGQPARGAAAVVAPRGGHRRGRADHPGDSRCGTCASGRTAATSCSGPRSSITSTRAKTWWRTRSCGWSRSGRVLAYPVQGVLVTRRHGEGARPAGGDVPARATARGWSGTRNARAWPRAVCLQWARRRLQPRQRGSEPSCCPCT